MAAIPSLAEKGGFRLVGRHKSKPADTGTASVLGERVRQLRTAQGLTLVELGVAAGLSHGFLSQLERDLARPSMSTLADIAVALGVSPGTLLSPAADSPAANGGVPHPSTDNREALMKVAENAGCFERSEESGHPGEEAVYVIEGRLEVEVAGETFLLGPGDVLNFDSSLAHAYRTIGDVRPRVLVITADPARRASPADETPSG
jgi:transcriptional regulator with XRE-family HTH domain